jgi:diguanylate cyclase (GGDEF)-like protein
MAFMLPRERALEALLALTDRKGARTAPATIERLVATTLDVIECDAAVLVTGNGGTRTLRRPGERQAQAVVTPESPFGSAVLRHGVPLVIADLSLDVRAGPAESCPGLDAGPALFVPLRTRKSPGAYLALYRRRGAPPFVESDTALGLLLVAWASAALDGLRIAGDLEKLAVTDDLTQVYNYRFLKTALRREIKRAGRFSQELAIVMIDVDNLKAYNDRHGHLRGSHLLKLAAGLIAEQVRSFDLVAKYGGDEFTLILPQTGREGALVVAERVRAAIEEYAFPLVERGVITISLGVAMFPEEASDGMSLIQVADRALYVAKQNGRNRVETNWPEAA